jgi:hypothetical protein
LPTVTPPEKNIQGSHDRTNRKSALVYLKKNTKSEKSCLKTRNMAFNNYPHKTYSSLQATLN